MRFRSSAVPKKSCNSCPPREDYERVRDAIRALTHEPRPAGCWESNGWVIRRGHIA
jgi:hypothetical protein